EDPARKDLLMEIGTEELSHLEIVGALIRMHLKPMKSDRFAAEADPLVAIAGGGGVSLVNSMGDAWTADYLKITGDLAVDLRSNIAAEARAKIVYERLIGFTEDQGSRQALQFLMTREITHMRAFSAALESMEKPPFAIGTIAPTPGLVDQYVNASTGEGDISEEQQRAPWNHSSGLQLVKGFDVVPARAGTTSKPLTNCRPLLWFHGARCCSSLMSPSPVEAFTYWSTRPGVGAIVPMANGGFSMLSSAAENARMCVISRVIRNCSACLLP